MAHTGKLLIVGATAAIAMLIVANLDGASPPVKTQLVNKAPSMSALPLSKPIRFIDQTRRSAVPIGEHA